MFGDFKEFGPPDGGLAGRGHDQAHGQRSRSPIPSQRNQGAPVQPKLFPEPWSTQHVGLDDSVKNGNYEQATLDKLADVDVKQRQRWITDVVNKQIQDPNRWISRCYQNHVMERQAQLATGMDRYGNLVKTGANQGGSSPAGQSRPQFSGGMAYVAPANSWNATQSGGARPPADPVPSGGGDGPIWAKQAFEMWPNNKTGLVREVCNHLSGEANDAVMGLDAPSAAAVCYGLLLAAPANDEGASVLMKQWLQRRQTFKATLTPPSPGLSSPLGGGKVIEIMLIVMGLTDGRAAILTHAAAKILQNQIGMQISFQSPIIIAPTAHKEIELLQSTCALTPSRHDITTFADLDTFIERTSAEWATRETKFLLINVVPQSAQFEKSQQNPTSNGLHSSETRWIFEAGKVAHSISQAVGEDNVASVMFSPTVLNSETKEALAALFGNQMESLTPCVNTVSNTPLIFAVPSGSVYQPVIAEIDKCLENDGWKMDPRVYAWSTKNLSLGTQAADLLTKKVFVERDWTSEEAQLMEALMSQHIQTGEKRYNNREWWMHQYGIMGQTPLPGFYKNRLPCHGNIYDITGLPNKGSSGVPCGKSRYCENCEKVIQQLDKAYNFSVMVNAVTNVLTRSVGIWKRGGDPVVFARTDTWARLHQCGPACVHNN